MLNIRISCYSHLAHDGVNIDSVVHTTPPRRCMSALAASGYFGRMAIQCTDWYKPSASRRQQCRLGEAFKHAMTPASLALFAQHAFCIRSSGVYTSQRCLAYPQRRATSAVDPARLREERRRWARHCLLRVRQRRRNDESDSHPASSKEDKVLALELVPDMVFLVSSQASVNTCGFDDLVGDVVPLDVEQAALAVAHAVATEPCDCVNSEKRRTRPQRGVLGDDGG